MNQQPNTHDGVSGGYNSLSETEALINKSVHVQPRAWSLEFIFEDLIRPCMVEFMGTTLFVFIGTTAICSGKASLEGVAIAHGFTIALLVMIGATISGSHYNPAVTLGVFIAGAISPLKALLYIFSQMIGGILGAAFTLAVVGSNYSTALGGGHSPTNTTPAEAVLCEVILTYLLVTTILVTAVDDDTKSTLFPLAIGFAVTVDILAGGGITGASMNPARSFGPAVVLNNNALWKYNWIYWVGPAIGGLKAGLAYRLFLASPEKRIWRFFSIAFIPR